MEVKLKNALFYKFGVNILFLILFVFFAYQKIAFYIRFDFNFILLIIILPFVIQKKSNEKSIRYGIIAIVLFLAYPIFKINSIYFLAFICSLFFLFESQFGKLNNIPLILILIFSPAAIFLSEVLGFEIRLSLTKIAAKTLSFFNTNYKSVGNIIMLGEQEFHVDPECMGLKMVILSLFTTIVFISFHQQIKKREYSFYSIILALILAYILVVISNLFRIILITIFMSPSGSFSHEFIGVICFICYVILPIWYLIKKLPSNERTDLIINETVSFKKTNYYIIAIILSSLFVIFKFSTIDNKQINTITQSSLTIDLKTFSSSIEDHGVLKLSKKNLLIYIKPASSYYSADHSPIICWKGSGYKIEKEQIITISNNRVYYSELKQENDTLYSSWWYESGNDKTISQFRWRFKSLTSGNEYCLVNLISNDKENLYKETESLLKQDLFIE